MPLILNLQRAIRYSFSDGTPWRAGCVALVVGTILNLINQGDAIFGAASINWSKNCSDLFGPLCRQYLRHCFLSDVEATKLSFQR